MNARVFIAIALIIAFSAFAVAQVPSSIRLTDCQINDSDSTAACSEQVPIVCDVAITYPDQLISSVTYTVSGSPRAATRIAGTNLNGTWQYIHTVSRDDDEQPISLDRVRATSSAGESCSGTRATQEQSDGCYVTFTGDRSIENTCVCDTTITAGAVQPDNTVTYTVTPNAGCVDQTVTTYTDFADYCDPEWTAEYSACTDTFSSGDSFTGTQTKTYYAANPSCCTQTQGQAGDTWFNHNTGSDCTPPIDHGTTQSCTLDTRVSYQEDTENTGADPAATGFDTGANTKYSAALQSEYEPLIYDVDGDGRTEIIAFSSSAIHVYENDMTFKTSMGLGTITGQPAFWGITDIGQSADALSIDLSTEKPLLLVPFYNASGVQYVGVYDFTASGVPTQVNATTFDTDGDTNPDTVNVGGITCHLNDCYMLQLASPYVQGYQLSMDSSGVTAVTNRNIGTTSQYFAKTKHSPTVTRDGEYVLWPIYYADSSGSGPYDRGAVVISEKDLSNLLYIRYNLLPDDAVLNNDNSTYQTDFDMVGSVVVSDGYAYISVKETVNSTTAGETDVLSVYRMLLEDDPTAYVGETDRQAEQRLVWSNEPTGTDEGISNVVVTDRPAVTVHSKQPSAVLGVEQFDSPVGEFAYQRSSDPVDPFEVDMFQQSGQWYVMYAHVNNVTIERIDGTHVFAYVYPTTKPITGVHVDALNNHMYVSQINDLGLGYQYGQVVRFDISSISSPTSDGAISAPTSPLSFTSAYSEISGVYDGYAYGYWRSMDGQFAFRVPVDSFSDSDVESITSTNIGSVNRQALVMQPDGVATVDNTTGLLMTSQFVYSDRDDPWSTVGSPTPGYYDLSEPLTTSAAFNFDWDDPRYLTYSGGTTYKVKVTGWDPFSRTVVANGCDYFYPLVYNSDSHILGIITRKSSDSGHTQTQDIPEFGICDYSDEVSPSVESLGIGVPFSSITSLGGGDYDFGVPDISLRPTNNAYDGTAVDYEALLMGAMDNSSDEHYVTYTLDSTMTSASAFTGASVRLVEFTSSNFAATDTITTDFEKRGYATVADWDADGVSDVITPHGAFLRGKGVFDEYTLGVNSVDETAVPVDVNADSVLDILTIMPNQFDTFLRVTSASAKVLLEGDLQINAFTCSVIPSTSNVRATLMATAPSPDALQVSIDKGDGSGFQSRTVSDSGQYTLRYSNAGTYTARIQVRQVGSQETDSATCTVTIPDTIAPTTQCSIGDDGEFMYTDSISNHGWTIMNGDVAPIGGYMILDAQESVKYPLSGCSYEEMTFEAMMQPGQLSTFRLLGADDSTSIGFTFDTVNGVIRDSSGGVLTAFEGYDTLSTFRIVVNNGQGKVRMYVGDQLVSSTDIRSFSPGAVQFTSEMTVDYVRITSSGDQLDVTTEAGLGSVVGMAGDVSYLESCESVASSLEYENVAQYCYSVDGPLTSGHCIYYELQKIASRYPDCTKEVYNYCVYEEYPRERGIPQNMVDGLSGASVCGTIIATGGAWSQIVEPSLSHLYDTFTSNLVVFLISITLLFIGLPLWVMSRRRR